MENLSTNAKFNKDWVIDKNYFIYKINKQELYCNLQVLKKINCDGLNKLLKVNKLFKKFHNKLLNEIQIINELNNVEMLYNEQNLQYLLEYIIKLKLKLNKNCIIIETLLIYFI